MESDLWPVTPSESNLVSDSPSNDAVRQGLSDAELNFPSPTLTQTSTPSPSQPVANPMSEEPSTPTRLASDAIPDLHRDILSSEHSQSEETTSVLGERHSSFSDPPSAIPTPSVPLSSSSEDSSRRPESTQAPEGPSVTSSTPYVLEIGPHLIPLPESDTEDEDPSEFARVERGRSIFGRRNQERGAYTTHIDERTSTSGSPDVHHITRPSTRFPLRLHPLLEVDIPFQV